MLGTLKGPFNSGRRILQTRKKQSVVDDEDDWVGQIYLRGGLSLKGSEDAPTSSKPGAAIKRRALTLKAAVPAVAAADVDEFDDEAPDDAPEDDPYASLPRDLGASMKTRASCYLRMAMLR